MEKVNTNYASKGFRRETLIITVIFFMLVLITWLLFIQKEDGLDRRILDALSDTINPGRTAFMKAVTFLGNFQFLIPANFLLILFFVWRKERGMARTVLIVALQVRSTSFQVCGMRD